MEKDKHVGHGIVAVDMSFVVISYHLIVPTFDEFDDHATGIAVSAPARQAVVLHGEPVVAVHAKTGGNPDGTVAALDDGICPGARQTMVSAERGGEEGAAIGRQQRLAPSEKWDDAGQQQWEKEVEEKRAVVTFYFI